MNIQTFLRRTVDSIHKQQTELQLIEEVRKLANMCRMKMTIVHQMMK